MARVVAIAPDLLLGSKIEAMLSAAGHSVDLSPALAGASLEDVELVVADLDSEDAEALARLDARVIGFYSHVNAETRQAAEAAGIELVVPRSRMARELPHLVDELLGP